jgi:hypothetical protein
MTDTDIVALIERLRKVFHDLVDYVPELMRAADALEALQAQVKADRIICHNEYADRFAEAKARAEKAEAALISERERCYQHATAPDYGELTPEARAEADRIAMRIKDGS